MPGHPWSVSTPGKDEGEWSAGEGASRNRGDGAGSTPGDERAARPGWDVHASFGDALAPLARVRDAFRRSVRRFLAGATLPGEIERVALNHGPHFLCSELLADRS